MLAFTLAARRSSSPSLLSFAPTLAKEGALGASLAGGRAARDGRRATPAAAAGARRRADRRVGRCCSTGAGLLTRTMQQLSASAPGIDQREGADDGSAEGLQRRTKPRRRSRDVRADAARDRGAPRRQQVGLGSTMPLRAPAFRSTSRPRAIRSRQARRSRTPSIARRIRSTSARRAFRCSRDARSRPPTREVGASRDHQQDAGRPILPRPGPDRPAHRVDGRGAASSSASSGDWRTVVGVVGDTKDGGLDARAAAGIFMPFAQERFPDGRVRDPRRRAIAAALGAAATRIVRIDRARSSRSRTC